MQSSTSSLPRKKSTEQARHGLRSGRAAGRAGHEAISRCSSEQLITSAPVGHTANHSKPSLQRVNERQGQAEFKQSQQELYLVDLASIRRQNRLLGFRRLPRCSLGCHRTLCPTLSESHQTPHTSTSCCLKRNRKIAIRRSLRKQGWLGGCL